MNATATRLARAKTLDARPPARATREETPRRDWSGAVEWFIFWLLVGLASLAARTVLI